MYAPVMKNACAILYRFKTYGVIVMIKRILIAEDHFESRESLTKLAILQGFDVIAVADGAEMLSIVNASKFDLVITDLNMPKLNGASVAEILELKRDKTPIIAVTGQSEHDVRWLKEKFLKIFYKPLDTKALFKFIKNLSD
jgi:DNA-binding response OmpR family regulator